MTATPTEADVDMKAFRACLSAAYVEYKAELPNYMGHWAQTRVDFLLEAKFSPETKDALLNFNTESSTVSLDFFRFGLLDVDAKRKRDGTYQTKYHVDLFRNILLANDLFELTFAPDFDTARPMERVMVSAFKARALQWLFKLYSIHDLVERGVSPYDKSVTLTNMEDGLIEAAFDGKVTVLDGENFQRDMATAYNAATTIDVRGYITEEQQSLARSVMLGNVHRLFNFTSEEYQTWLIESFVRDSHRDNGQLKALLRLYATSGRKGFVPVSLPDADYKTIITSTHDFILSSAISSIPELRRAFGVYVIQHTSLGWLLTIRKRIINDFGAPETLCEEYTRPKPKPAPKKRSLAFWR
ncbi:Hypothetical protein POVN_LOCUS326 [uncultured virus]|nr:Hypothetical protein POVN_LOCUS326 [uncultured virus]